MVGTSLSKVGRQVVELSSDSTFTVADTLLSPICFCVKNWANREKRDSANPNEKAADKAFSWRSLTQTWRRSHNNK